MGHGCGKRNKIAGEFWNFEGRERLIVMSKLFFFFWSCDLFCHHYKREEKKEIDSQNLTMLN